ncbi:hypothetical protein [Microbacterium jiangjiandongii]|uniref:hypothetical protein n=1 Tax=Microbacterium jiangjiandongii TaxID=3049071 RepID=UPI00214AC97D|nr:hypothetical protein [Microbacterium sp. zg.Y843]MCR2816863.1 hypothetical protein [Microbacterium sp. zg.Y843]
MSEIDFQVDVGRFLAAQRSYLRRLALCPPVLPAVGGMQLVLDRVDVGSSRLRHDEPTTFDVAYVQRGDVVRERDASKGFRTVLEQDLVLQLTTDADIRGNPNVDPPLVAWPVTMFYELTAFSVDDDCCLKAEPIRVEFGPPPALPVPVPPGVSAALESYVSGQMRLFAPSGTVRLGLDSLKLPTGFLNAGLSVDDIGTTLVIRVEIRASQDLRWAAWENFHKGFIVDRRQGRDWALYVPAAYITHRVVNEVWRQLPRNDDLETYPSAAYVPLAGRARLDVDVLAIYHLVEVDEIDLDITVSAQPRVSLTMWIDRPNRLSAEIDFAGIVNPVGGLSNLVVALLDGFGIPFRAFLYHLIGEAIVDAVGEQPQTAVSQPDAAKVRVDRDVLIPGIAGVARATATDLIAHPDGIAIAGAFQISEPTNAVVELLGVSPFAKHVPRVSCGAASMALIALFGSEPERFEILRAGVSLGNRGTAPLRLCAAPALQRLDGPVQPADIRVDDVSLPIEVSMGIGMPQPAYYDAAFPIDLMVRTNGGTRFIRFDPPPVVTQADLDRLQAELLVKIGDCQQLVDPWFKGHRGYNVHWSPRPPEDGHGVLHHWEVLVDGLPDGERLELRELEGEVLASAIGVAGSPTRVSVVVTPSGRDREVSIVRVGENHQEFAQDAPARGLQIRQADLIVVGEVPLSQPVRGVGLAQLPDGPAIVAMLGDRVQAFDLREGAATGEVGAWPGRFHGMLRVGEGTLLYGDDGISQLRPDGRLVRTGIRTAVVDAERAADGAYLVTSDRVLEVGADLSILRESDRPDVTSVGRLGANVLLGHAEGIDTADAGLRLRGGGERRRGGERPALPAVRTLSRAGRMRRSGLLARWDDGSAGLLEDHDGEPVEVAHFAEPPLLANALRIGARLIIADDSAERLRVLRMGRSVTL